MMREVALKTSDVVGDGTTTATALAATIAKEGIRAVAAGIRRASYRKPHSQNDRLWNRRGDEQCQCQALKAPLDHGARCSRQGRLLASTAQASQRRLASGIAPSQSPRNMSALPPIATELVRRNELTRCAKRSTLHCKKNSDLCRRQTIADTTADPEIVEKWKR